MRYLKISIIVYAVFFFFCIDAFAAGKRLNALKNRTEYSEQISLQGIILEDVDGIEHDLGDLQDNVVVLITSIRENRKTVKKWMNALKQAFKEQVNIRFVVLVNDVSGRPFFISKNRVRGDIRKDNKNKVRQKNHLLLIDWDMKGSSVLKASADKSEIFLFDKKGRLQHRVGTSFSKKNVRQITAQVSVILNED